MTYISGNKFGFPESCMVHEAANIVGNPVFGEHCRIDAFSTITGRVRLGGNVHIGVGACIFGGAGVTIGDGVSISPGAKIFSVSENPHCEYVSNPQVENRQYLRAPVKIGEFSVVGANSVVLPGAEIGKECVVGACSLLKEDARVADGFIVAGVPATYIGKRTPLDREAIAGTKTAEFSGV